MMYEDFCKKLKNVRRIKGITVDEIADGLNEKCSRIRDIENGKTEILLSEFLRWCEYLDVSPRSFFDSPYSLKIIRYKQVCERIEDLEGKDFELVRQIVDMVYNKR